MAQEHDDTPRPLAEISHGPSAFESFLDRNQKGMVVAGVVLALAGGAWIVTKGLKQSRANAAGEELGNAESLAEFQDVVKKHAGTPAAGSAAILISEKQWEAGEQDTAIETLRKFIADSPEHPAIPSAKASLATRLMQQGKSDEAITIFKELVGNPAAKYIAPYALVSIGDIDKAAGRLQDAEASYKRVAEEFKGSPFASLADQHLKLVSFKMPVEIEAPPAPATPDTTLPMPELTPGAATPGMGDAPFGNLLNGEGATPAPPVEEAPALPTKDEAEKPEGEEPAKPDAVLPVKPEEGQAPPPSEKPAEGESN